MSIIEVIQDVTVVQLASDGPQGPQGPQGAQGATGATGSSGQSFNTQHLSGRYVRSQASVAPSTRSATLNRTTYIPILIPTTTTYDRIGVTTGSTFSGTGTVRVGIYNNTNGKPSTVVLDAGTISATALSTAYEITISQTLAAGFYWLAFNSTSNATVNTYLGLNATASTITTMNSYATQAWISAAPSAGFLESVNATSGFSTAGTLIESTEAMVIGLRVA